MSLYLIAGAVGVVLNIVLSMIASPLATKDEIKPAGGASSLSFKSQIMHMLVHHKQVLLTSSVIVFVLVASSVKIGEQFSK